MRKLLLLILVATSVSFTASSQGQKAPNDYAYTHAVWTAIRLQSHDGSMRFGDKTYEKITGNIYEQKWTVKGSSAMGYAKVKYKGGDPQNLSNWEVIKAYIN